MSTLQDAIEAVQDAVLSVSGVYNAPDSPTGVTGGSYPFVLTTADVGEWAFGAPGEAKGLHSIRTELHFPFKGLAWTIEKCMEYSDNIPLALMKDSTLGGVIDTFESISYTFGPLGYMGIDTIGFAWTLNNVKIRTAT